MFLKLFPQPQTYTLSVMKDFLGCIFTWLGHWTLIALSSGASKVTKAKASYNPSYHPISEQ